MAYFINVLLLCAEKDYLVDLPHGVSVVTKFGLVVARPVREVGEPSQQPWSHPQEDGQVLSY